MSIQELREWIEKTLIYLRRDDVSDEDARSMALIQLGGLLRQLGMLDSCYDGSAVLTADQEN